VESDAAEQRWYKQAIAHGLERKGSVHACERYVYEKHPIEKNDLIIG